MIVSGIFPPDPMAGFPSGAASGAVGFLCLAAAAFAAAGWMDQRDAQPLARYSRVSGTVVVAGFLGGAALATRPLGGALLWTAVVAGLVWLAAASVFAYRTVPHPDADRRPGPAPASS